MNKLITIALLSVLVGCDAHMVTKELLVEELHMAKVSAESRINQCISASAKILPIELSNKIESNSIFWLPIIPAPGNDKEGVEKIRIAIDYNLIVKECSVSDISLISKETEYQPWWTYVYKPRNEITRCIYEFSLSGSDVDYQGVSLEINADKMCDSSTRPLMYIKKTDYENHYQPW